MKNNSYKLLDLVVTAKEMAEIDRTTIEDVGIPGAVLMENAGRKIVSVICRVLAQVRGANVVILCGKGNNGGDGYVVARYLNNLGAQVKVRMIAEAKELKGDAALNCSILARLDIDMAKFEARQHASELQQADVIVDALLGTGVTGALKSGLADIVTLANDSRAMKFAIDLPTGMVADTGAVLGACFNADHTVTMGHLKRGLLFSPGREQAGAVHIADIGFPPSVSEASGVRCYRTTRAFVQHALPRRQMATFKNRCGQVLVIAGSPGMTGAATLSSEAALRAGAGMAMLAIPQSLNSVLEQKLTEVMTLPLPETSEQTVSFQASQILSDKFEWANTLAVGPGLTTQEDSARLVNWILDEYDGKIVLDADALNCLSQTPDAIRKARGDLILTPHPGELARLTNIEAREILSDPIEVAKRVASDFNVVLVLKGAPTVVASPDGVCFVNSTGNPGMATAGMGDVLTGVIAGLCAQGASPVDAAIVGVYSHGLAADLAQSEAGQMALIAGDVLKYLAFALRELESQTGSEVLYV